eukprot:scaffold111261_cov46-Prasinocladus_malaysianus.AAC.1
MEDYVKAMESKALSSLPSDDSLVDELRRALAVSHGERQALQAKLKGLEASAQADNSTSEARILESRVAMLQEELEREKSEAARIRVRTEEAMKAVAGGAEGLLAQGLADPAMRQRWPRSLAEVVASVEAAAVQRAVLGQAKVTGGLSVAEIVRELAQAREENTVVGSGPAHIYHVELWSEPTSQRHESSAIVMYTSQAVEQGNAC